MKLRGAKQVHYDSGPNMTPLVDVVMVILIFLMLAGSFGGGAHFLASNIPIRKTGAGQVQSRPDQAFDEPLRINIRPAPGGAGFIAQTGDLSVVRNPQELTDKLEQRLEEMEKIGYTRDKIQVLLAPTQDVRYEYVAAVYEAALRAGFTKVGFVVA